METINVVNPWTGTVSEKSVSDVMSAIDTFASAEECEATNLEFSGDTDKEWLETFTIVHGENRLSAIAFS